MYYICIFMNGKAERHEAILLLIAERTVGTHAELKALLKARGIEADQATLSRDIRELGIVKTSDGERTRYAPVEAVAPPVQPRATAVIGRLVRQVEISGNLLVLKTGPGEANPVPAQNVDVELEVVTDLADRGVLQHRPQVINHGGGVEVQLW